ncbi:MAG: glycerophosphodiester phosphodiesterase [Armatimonadota bacterium]|nr:glycerophosphodiester phosphodiesterase [bacterium]
MKGLVVTLFAIALSTLGAGAQAGLEIIAHRGASSMAPENTLAAINLAWKLSADAVEIDIYLTKDGRTVVMHDSSTARTTGVDMKPSDHTLDELRSLDAGKWKGEQWAGEKIPTLNEVLQTIPRGKRLLVEIKCGPEVLPEFFNALKHSRKSDKQVAVISFDAKVIKAVKSERPSLQAYLLCSPGLDGAKGLIQTAQSINADGLDVCATDAVNAEFVKQCRDAKMRVYVWTVDDEATATRMAALKVDGITTNKPKEIKQLLRRQ